MQNINELVFKMLTESTGTHFLDSGGEDGRHWQRNVKKTLADFESEPKVTTDVYTYNNEKARLADVSVTISLFHYLTGVFELDEITEDFNTRFNVMADYESDFNYISAEAGNYLTDLGFEVLSDKQNTYNFDNYFSQDVLYTPLKLADTYYYLVSIHNGADVRGGYTDAKLFKLCDHLGFAFSYVTLVGNINGLYISNQDNGYTLTLDTDNETDLDNDTLEVKETDKIELDYYL